MQNAIGWISGAILLLTLGSQMRKQWKTDSAEGVSSWLFIGQVAASVGFVTYSILVQNWVFIITNSLILASAILGLFLTWRLKRKHRPS